MRVTPSCESSLVGLLPPEPPSKALVLVRSSRPARTPVAFALALPRLGIRRPGGRLGVGLREPVRVDREPRFEVVGEPVPVSAALALDGVGVAVRTVTVDG